MNVKVSWQKGRWYILVAVAGIALGVALVFLLGAGSLSAKLAETRAQLVDAQAVSRLATSSNLRLQQELASANQSAATLKSELVRQQQITDNQAHQLSELASTVTVTGANIEASAVEIARLIDGLYSIYNGGTKSSASP